MISPLSRWVRSTAIATIATCLMLAVVIVLAEEVPALKDWLKASFYHHWLGKGALALLLFAAVATLFRFKRETPRLSSYIAAEVAAVVLSVVVIAGFFLLHVLHFV